MGMMANIVCKGVGIAGMSAVLYDACSVAKLNSKRAAQSIEADHFEKIHADTRILSEESEIGNAVQKKVADLRMNNPLFSLLGNIKGFAGGFLSSLGDNIVPVSLASFAIAAKGKLAKAGTWGLAGYGVYKVLKEGFGLSKKSSVD